MSPYLAGGMLLAFVAWSGFMYYEGTSKEIAVCKGDDAQHDLAQANITVSAEKGVIDTIGQQQTITKGVDNDYQAKEHDIDNQYAAGLNGVWTSGFTAEYNLPTSGNTTHRHNATTPRSFHTKVFKLNAKECDENTEQLYGLQKWIKDQQSIKQPGFK